MSQSPVLVPPLLIVKALLAPTSTLPVLESVNDCKEWSCPEAALTVPLFV